MDITAFEFITRLAGSRSAGACLLWEDSDPRMKDSDPHVKGPEAFTEEDMLKFRREGWIEEWDVLHGNEPLLRKNAARILHMYMLKVLKEPDEASDGPSRKVLRDIFDCRVCANHVAQVYDKGIMDGFFYEDGNVKETSGNGDGNVKETSENGDGNKEKTSRKKEELGVFELSRNMDYDEAIDSIRRVFDKNLRRRRQLTD